MSRRVWLIPIQPSPTQLKATVGVLERHDIDYSLVSPDLVRDRLNHRVPRAGIVHGGAITPILIDVQRWLTEFQVPTLVLAEGLTDHYEATLLDRGARDVVAVPTSTRKLGSRLEALLRPQFERVTRQSLPMTISVAGLIDIYPRRRAVEVNQVPVDLTKSEFDLLLALALHQGDVVTREELAEVLGHADVSARALESHVSRVRMKLRQAGAADHLDAVRSVGYRLRNGA